MERTALEHLDTDTMMYRYEEGGSAGEGNPKLVLPRESEGEVLRAEDGREYVMYRNEQTGEMVKVFGSWNEAPRVTERDVTQNEDGEFILDEAMLDTEINEDGPTMAYDQKIGRKMPVAKTKNLLAQLGQMGAKTSDGQLKREYGKFEPNVERGIGMKRGGKTYRYNE